jgi:hypothetical protein
MQRAQPDDRARHAGFRQDPLTCKREAEAQPVVYSRTNAAMHGIGSAKHSRQAKFAHQRLAGVVLLDEYRRRRSELERRQQQLEEQVTRLEAQTDRQKELAGLSASIAKFSQRVQQGVAHASFEQKRSLVELLIDRVIVTDGEVEIRYVMPTTDASEQVRFCHLRLDYRAGSPWHQRSLPTDAWVQVPSIG